MKVLRIVRNIVLWMLALCLCGLATLALLGWQLYTDALEAMPLDQRVKQIRSQESYTSFANLPDTYVEAVLAAEDHRFYEHGGVDPIALGRALINDIKTMSFVEGGSTITQQLAKNLFFTQEKRLSRKVAELFMAFHIEANYSKEEIFELYVNSIYFGSGCYDVASASRTYFGVEPSAMDADQCTLLAGIPNAPSVYDPTVNPELSEQRQRQVVQLMVKYEYLTDNEASAILTAA
ncbi:MAG: transglycosylase domain-containing protein [Acutalibacter sp.]|jgi:monofunctional glycosyltransferase